MSNKQRKYDILYQNYRQFIEFINDLCFPSYFYIMLIYLPFLTIFGDLLTHINQDNFLFNLSNLSFSTLLFKLIEKIPELMIVIKISIFLSLVLPVFVIFLVLVQTFINLQQTDIEIGYFHMKYTNSNTCRIIRLYINIYQRILFPIFVSISIKLVRQGQSSAANITNQTTGILILIFSVINSVIYHYYNLQIPTQKSQQQFQYKQINFPNPLIQTLFIFLNVILVNTLQGIFPYISCVSLIMLETLITHFLKFENQILYPEFQFSLYCANSIILAFLIGFLNGQPSIMTFFACITIFLLLKGKRQNSQNKAKYFPVQSTNQTSQITFGEIKRNLKAQKIAKAFRQAVFFSRKKNSHRTQLSIDIIKSKCYDLECESRGSTKVADSILLLKYEVKIVEIIKKILQVQQKSIQVLTIMKSKQPKQQLLIKTVVELVDQINENKQNFIQCVKINALASELNLLMNLFFRVLYNDGIFLRKVRSDYRNEISQLYYNRIQKQLFTKEAVLVVINIADEIGKITKVSNNMPNILGYTAHTLIGMSINGLIPLSIRQVHDDIIRNFIDSFSSQVMRKKPSVEFYAYDKFFHLQKVQVRYKFFLHSFQNCQLSSVLRKLKTEQYAILTDQMGNIQGWTAQLGELLNFDELSGAECNAYNIVPLIPAYAKYDSQQQTSFKSLFFRLSKMKTPRIMLKDQKQKPNMQQMKKRQIHAFNELLQRGEIIEAFFLNINIEIRRLERFNKTLKVIKFTQLRRIQNFQQIQRIILKGGQRDAKQQNVNFQRFGFISEIHPDKSLDESLDVDFSILKEKNVDIVNADLNFTLDKQKQGLLTISDLKFTKQIDRFQSVFSSRSLLKLDNEEENIEESSINQNLSLQSNFDPKLERFNNFIWAVVVVTIIVFSLIIEDQITLSNIFTKLQSNKTQIFKANRAQMIYCKSVFNPNLTYISQFQNGKLQFSNQWLFDKNSTYITHSGNKLNQNNYYLLNIQLPSNLQRVLYYNGKSSNLYSIQMQSNFYQVISMFHELYTNFKSVWEQEIQAAKLQCSYKMIAFSGGALIYLLFLGFIWYGYKKQRKISQSFFKFQKIDINDKITQIKSISKTLEKKCTDWFIDEYLSQIKKQKPPKKQTYCQTQSQMLKKQIQLKKSQPDFGYSKLQAGEQVDQFQTKITQRRFYLIVGLIIFIMLTQILFLILHGVLNNQMLNNCKDVLNKFQQANKLIVYPNLKMANLYYRSSSQIVNQYENLVKKTLDQPMQSMPALSNLLSQKPCEDCQFLSDILSTNYRSFYSYFIQLMNSYNATEQQFKQLYKAVDVVAENITKSLTTKQIQSPRSVMIIYIFSVLVFFGSVIVITRKLEQEYSKLECFLKFFHQEALLKNKHLSTVMAKNM